MISSFSLSYFIYLSHWVLKHLLWHLRCLCWPFQELHFRRILLFSNPFYRGWEWNCTNPKALSKGTPSSVDFSLRIFLGLSVWEGGVFTFRISFWIRIWSRYKLTFNNFDRSFAVSISPIIFNWFPDVISKSNTLMFLVEDGEPRRFFIWLRTLIFYITQIDDQNMKLTIIAYRSIFIQFWARVRGLREKWRVLEGWYRDRSLSLGVKRERIEEVWR